MVKSLYGQPEGLPTRLRQWAERLGTDRSLPWMGLGLVADLKIAADELEKVKVPDMEYDL